jgi:hypothetical protein
LASPTSTTSPIAGPLPVTPPVEATEVVGGAVEVAALVVEVAGVVVVEPGHTVVGSAATAVAGLVLSGGRPASCGELAANAPVAQRTSTLAAMVAASAGRDVITGSVRVG